MKRRTFILSAVGMAFAGSVSAVRSAALPKVEVFRNPGCGCCEGWVDHMRNAGFEVSIEDDANLEGRLERLGIPSELGSCHVGISSGFAFVGHIPSIDVSRFLSSPPADAVGLTVPGMPVGSPGMGPEGSGGPYNVLLISRLSKPSVYASH
ncbi:MAG: DUF411 domain-containing protein [Rhizobiales bacterium]|nr:DUF411 domain-containing protein [Hyphomicrobiales bacterium]